MTLAPLLCALLAGPAVGGAPPSGDGEAGGAKKDRPPNVVVIFCDDLGWGDLACFGHPTIATPHLDDLAARGMRWTQFYCAAPVCTPSRAGLLTGRIPVRSGTMQSDAKGSRRVLFPDSAGGLPPGEVTIAEVLKPQGYATACVGKWHLGHLPQYLPTAQGFDYYYGIPYSNDMDRLGGDHRVKNASGSENYDVPLLRSKAEGEVETVERPADQKTITRRYGEEAASFIKAHADGPFFLYLAHNMPHIPLFAPDEVRGESPRGLYGDVITEIDRSVGAVVQAVRDAGVEEDTQIWFTSDNGPWLSFKQDGGSAGPLRGGKGGTFEGGVRVPTICCQPGTVPAGVVQRGLGSTLDFLPTFAAMAGAELPEGVTLDGVDLAPALTGQSPAGESPRTEQFYWREGDLYAVRSGPWKAHFITHGEYGTGYGVPNKRVELETPLLYNLDVDPEERYDLAGKHQQIVDQLTEIADAHRAAMTRGEDVTAARLPRD
ncbi:sulfatase family protein [Alienimonas californiensis]|uniref:Arylsulfatase n=1 Tax=Alienimonas californiensis TaxID=2527989 RepID=A0A517P3Q5_9PLAN|nr:sulfatase [Alienimonas californiensis]QDT14007.1 Arylsulfatase [Alienimonas californiensis]